MKLANRTVLVTGGTGGIGLGMAEAFLKANSKVIVCGRNQEKLARVKENLPDITTINCDIGDARRREKLAKDVLQLFPDLDVLVNNAGIQRHINLKKGYKELKSGEDEISINFVAVVELTALFIDHLLQKPSAAIINVSSRLAFMPMLNIPLYCATKAAVHTYTLVLRQQLKQTNIKVFEVAPPMVDTDLNKKGRDAARSKFRGISVSEYIPAVIRGLENDTDIIFHGDSGNILTEPRGISESRLLTPS